MRGKGGSNVAMRGKEKRMEGSEKLWKIKWEMKVNG